MLLLSLDSKVCTCSIAHREGVPLARDADGSADRPGSPLDLGADWGRGSACTNDLASLAPSASAGSTDLHVSLPLTSFSSSSRAGGASTAEPCGKVVRRSTGLLDVHDIYV